MAHPNHQNFLYEKVKTLKNIVTNERDLATLVSYVIIDALIDHDKTDKERESKRKRHTAEVRYIYKGLDDVIDTVSDETSWNTVWQECRKRVNTVVEDYFNNKPVQFISDSTLKDILSHLKKKTNYEESVINKGLYLLHNLNTSVHYRGSEQKAWDHDYILLTKSFLESQT